MNQTSTFQTVIESVEALSQDEQNQLFDLIHKRRIIQRREEIAQRSLDVTAAIKTGQLRWVRSKTSSPMSSEITNA